MFPPLEVPNYASLQTNIWFNLFTGLCLYIAITASDIEIDRYVNRLLAFGVTIYCGNLFVWIQLADHGVTKALLQANTIYLSFFLGFITSLTIYRLFLHRCSEFPGPWLAGLSRFYAVGLNANLHDSQYYLELERLHRRYGDYVRIGPREFSILDKAALPLIYGPKTECEKATWYSQVSYNPDDVNIGSIRDPTKHRQRRRAWDRGLSTKALLTYEPRIKAKVDMLIERLKAQAGRPIDATAWSMFFSFDVMGDLSFGQDFGNLATGKEHPGIRSMHSYLWLFGVLSPVPWLMNLLMALPSAARALIDFDSVCLDVLERKEKSWDSTQEPTDVVSWFLKAIQEKDISACPTRNSLFEDTKGVVIAGSDTTANALTNILFYLSRHPSIQQKLHHHLHTAMPGGYAAFSYAAVRKLSYLDDIINETLRLKPPVIQGQPRETPAQGLQVGNVWIPGRVNVAVPTLSIQRDARWWPQAESFIPERWGERREEMRTDGAPWNVFQSGVHACAGKALAYVTLRIVVAALVMGFEVRVAEEESEERLRVFEGRFLSSLLMGLRPLGVVFRER